MLERRVEITPMHSSDLDAVLAIEELASRSPWSREIFSEELEREWARIEVVRERTETDSTEVAAYINYWLVRDEIHVLNLVTHPDRQRRGHARRLLKNLIEFGRRHDCKFVTLEVRRSNAVAIALYESFGFRQVGLRPRYYAEDDEDAFVMLLELPPVSVPVSVPVPVSKP